MEEEEEDEELEDPVPACLARRCTRMRRFATRLLIDEIIALGFVSMGWLHNDCTRERSGD